MECKNICLAIACIATLYGIVHSAPVSKTEPAVKVVLPSDTSKDSSPEDELNDLTQLAYGAEKSSPVEEQTDSRQDQEQPSQEEANEANTYVQATEEDDPFIQKMLQEEAEANQVPERELTESYSNMDLDMPQEQDSMQQALYDPDLDLTPKAVAEYLLVTEDFDGFDNAVTDILRAHIMTPEEAQMYRDAVGFEYEELLKKMIEAESSYLQEAVQPETPSVMEYREPLHTRASGMNGIVADNNMMDIPNVDLGIALEKLRLKAMLERESTLDDLLRTIADDYLAQSAQTGEAISNEEAELQDMIDLLGEQKGSAAAAESDMNAANLEGLTENEVEDAPAQPVQASAEEEQVQKSPEADQNASEDKSAKVEVAAHKEEPVVPAKKSEQEAPAVDKKDHS